MMLNFSHNKYLSKNIKSWAIALGDEVCDDIMLMSSNIDGGHSSTSRLANTHAEYERDELEKMGFFDQTVRIMTLDEFTTVTKIFPHVIKIDIEGAEHLFLLGGLNFLSNHSPILYIEMHSQYCTLICSELLIKLGYESEVVQEEPDRRIIVKFIKKGNIKNDVLVKTEKMKSIQTLKKFEYENILLIKRVSLFSGVKRQLRELEMKYTKLTADFAVLEAYKKNYKQPIDLK